MYVHGRNALAVGVGLQGVPSDRRERLTDFFVGGAMRSGTTVLNRLLCTSSDVNNYIPEVKVLRQIVALYRAVRLASDDIREPYFSTFGDCTLYFASCLGELLSRARALHNPEGSLVLKSPELTMDFSELAELHPGARFILIVRDPRDCVASMKAVASRARAADRPFPVPEMANGVEGMATLYLRYYAGVVNSGLIHNAHRLLTLRYEDLVQRPAEAVGRIWLWSGLECRIDDVEYENRYDSSALFDSSLYGKPISAEAVGCFEDRLTAAEVASVEKVTSDFMTYYGYQRVAVEG